jgi:hypothetical protein
MGDARLHLDAERFQMLRHETRCLEFPVAQFGVLMDLVAQFDDFRSVALHRAVYGRALGGQCGR